MIDIFDAIHKGDIELLKQSIAAGADANARDKDGRTPLMKAAEEGNFDIVKYLVEEGADVNAEDESDVTALMYAAGSGNLDIVKYLIEQGADVNAEDEDCWTALMYVAKTDNYEMVRCLVDLGADMKAKDNSGKTYENFMPVYSRSVVCRKVDKDGFLIAEEYHDPNALPKSADTTGGLVSGSAFNTRVSNSHGWGGNGNINGFS